MLDCPSLQSLDRKSSITQLREIATLHKTMYAGLNDLLNHRLNNCFAVHNSSFIALTVESQVLDFVNTATTWKPRYFILTRIISRPIFRPILDPAMYSL